MGTGNHDEIERKMNDQPYFWNEDEEPKEKGHGCYDDENMCHGAILEQSNNILIIDNMNNIVHLYHIY